MPQYIEAYGQTIEFPDGMSPGDIEAAIKKGSMDIPRPPPERSTMQNIGQTLGNIGAGAVRGAGSIGATLLAPGDMIKDAFAGKGLEAPATLNSSRCRAVSSPPSRASARNNSRFPVNGRRGKSIFRNSA